MKEQLISFKTAKLAKEKGFDIEVSHYYEIIKNNTLIVANWKKQNLHSYFGDDSDKGGFCILEGFDDINDDNLIKAPTQSLLQKWLREEYKLYVYIPDPSWKEDKVIFYYKIHNLNDPIHDRISNFRFFKNLSIKGIYNTYEEALEEGLQEALKLIEL